MEGSPASEEPSQNPLRVDPLSDASLAAFDELYRRVAAPRIEEQLATIVRLQRELAQKDEIIAKMKHGYGLCVRDVWEDYKYRNPWCKIRLEPSFHSMKLDMFLRQMAMSWGYLKAAHDVFQVASASDANVGISDSIEPPSMQHASAYTRRLAA